MIFNTNFKMHESLDEKELKFIDEVVSRSKVKPNLAQPLKKVLTNSAAFYNANKNVYSAAGIMTTSFTETFKSLAMVVSTKFFTSTILGDIATIVPVNAPETKVFVTTWVYRSDLPAEGISTGNKLSDKRSKTFSNVSEGSDARKLGVSISAVDLVCKPRPIEQSYTLHALMNLNTIYTPEQVDDFLNNKFVGVISQKLRDEAEYAIISNMFTNAGLKVDYTVGQVSDCETLECEAIKLYNSIDDVANEIFKKTGIKNNILIIGKTAYNLLRNLDVKKYNFVLNDGLISDLARNVIGTLDKTYKVIYDPWLENEIILTVKSEAYDIAPVVYGSFIPLAITPEFVERNLEIYRIVYTVDGWNLIYPEVIGAISLS